MPVVVNMGNYRKKGVLTAARELFMLATKGQIVGLHFRARLKDGGLREGIAGTVHDAESPDSVLRAVK